MGFKLYVRLLASRVNCRVFRRSGRRSYVMFVVVGLGVYDHPPARCFPRLEYVKFQRCFLSAVSPKAIPITINFMADSAELELPRALTDGVLQRHVVGHIRVGHGE